MLGCRLFKVNKVLSLLGEIDWPSGTLGLECSRLCIVETGHHRQANARRLSRSPDYLITTLLRVFGAADPLIPKVRP